MIFIPTCNFLNNFWLFTPRFDTPDVHSMSFWLFRLAVWQQSRRFLCKRGHWTKRIKNSSKLICITEMCFFNRNFFNSPEWNNILENCISRWLYVYIIYNVVHEFVHSLSILINYVLFMLPKDTLFLCIDDIS